MFVGHKFIVSRFNLQLPDSVQGHAFLFSGPESVGKKTFAWMFADAFVQRAGNIDMQDLNTRDSYSSGDILFVAPEVVEKKGIKKQRAILIEHIRESISKLALSSRSGGRRVLIVDDAHMLTPSSQNALLKTLEEPDTGKMIILITREVGQILSTIRSRCVHMSFSIVSESDYVQLFPEMKKADIRRLYMLSFGHPGRAKRITSDSVYAEKTGHNMQIFEEVRSMGRLGRLHLGEMLSKDISSAVETLELWIACYRELAFKGNIPIGRAFSQAERLEQTLRLLRYTNTNPRLLLENICLVLE